MDENHKPASADETSQGIREAAKTACEMARVRLAKLDLNVGECTYNPSAKNRAAYQLSGGDVELGRINGGVWVGIETAKRRAEDALKNHAKTGGYIEFDHRYGVVVQDQIDLVGLTLDKGDPASGISGSYELTFRTLEDVTPRVKPTKVVKPGND